MKAIMLHAESTAVGYYRIWQQAKYLRRQGWEVFELPHTEDQKPIPIAKWEMISRNTDIMVVQRSDHPDVIALTLAMGDLCNCPVVYETDDNIYDVAESSFAYQYFFPGSPLIDVVDTHMRHCDAITVSTSALAEAYKHNNENFYILPNCQDPEAWEGIKRPRSNGDKLVIGWAGSATHYDDLYMIRRPLKKILRKYPHVQLRIIGCIPDFLYGHPQIEFRTDLTGIEGWYRKLAELDFDIGLAPVVQRPFNEGKSNIKWQEYSMLEIPTIASRVGEYKEIQHNETGLLAGDEQAWLYYMEKLINDADLRDYLGRNARQYVMKNLNIQKNIKQWDRAYRNIIKSGRHTGLTV